MHLHYEGDTQTQLFLVRLAVKYFSRVILTQDCVQLLFFSAVSPGLGEEGLFICTRGNVVPQ